MIDLKKKYLNDIKTAIDKLYKHLSLLENENEYFENITIKSAVEREFEIIGEAMSKLLKIDPKIKISTPERIISMRNRLIHGYDNIDDKVVMQVVKDHIPTLKEEVNNLLEE